MAKTGFDLILFVRMYFACVPIYQATRYHIYTVLLGAALQMLAVDATCMMQRDHAHYSCDWLTFAIKQFG